MARISKLHDNNLFDEGAAGDDDVESYAEEFIAAVTSAEFVGEDARDEMLVEELGGPFLELEAVDLASMGFVDVPEQDTDAI
ncbi:MAG: hypothetical protein JNL38_03590 [Myxococcales bacterium]|jgi:hypothetical protein|nr:hypothetical protein [Myxococcales bacterium]